MQAFERLLSEMNFIEGAMDVEMAGCHDPKSDRVSIHFFSAKSDRDYLPDVLEFDTMQDALDFATGVTLMIRMGRAQRRGN